MSKINTKQKEVKIKSLSVKKYNENISDIDRQDQMYVYCPFERKTLRWYKKFGLNFIHLLPINSYFIYNKHVKKYHCITTDFQSYKGYYLITKIFK